MEKFDGKFDGLQTKCIDFFFPHVLSFSDIKTNGKNGRADSNLSKQNLHPKQNSIKHVHIAAVETKPHISKMVAL